MRQPNVAVYGSHACPDTCKATEYLDGKSIPYEFKDVDQFPEYNDYIAERNGGKRVLPFIQIDNATFVNPGPEALGRAVAEAAEARA